MSESRMIEESARRLKEAEVGSPTLEAFIDWLKGAFFTYQSQKAELLEKLARLRALALAAVGDRPLSVEEAQLLNVCRVCRGTPGVPFLLNYGKEYAHPRCVDAAPKS